VTRKAPRILTRQMTANMLPFAGCSKRGLPCRTAACLSLFQVFGRMGSVMLLGTLTA